MEFNKTVIIGTTVSGETTVAIELHKEVAGRQTVRLEHLQQHANLSTSAHHHVSKADVMVTMWFVHSHHFHKQHTVGPKRSAGGRQIERPHFTCTSQSRSAPGYCKG